MTVDVDRQRMQRVPEFFRKAVDDGRLPGFALRINCGTDTILRDHYGLRDIEADLPVEEDTRYRIFSMTKPMTSVAAMMLYERGALDLRAPLRDYIGEFAETPVWDGTVGGAPGGGPQTTELTVWHLLTHTSGLTYSFLGANVINERYDALCMMDPFGPMDLAAGCAALATVPLLFQPGTAWNYSVSTDVLGRVIEVASGTPLDDFFSRELLQPLGMSSTGFSVPAADRHRLATLYTGTADDSSFTPRPMPPPDAPTLFSGGAGLYSTVDDYQRFVLALANDGELEGHRLLAPRTLTYMTRNHLPDGLDLSAHQRHPLEDDLGGLGFGLGFATVIDAPRRRMLTGEGAYYWNGAGGSTFLVDPATGVSATFMMQVRSPSNHRWESRLHQLLYQSLV
jgi:CubicO group peptidase (beta-lactamase class C family)